MNPSIATESISFLQVSDVQNLKGGERTTSEWEELEKLTKDELIIELVHWKNMYGILRVERDSDCPWPYAQPMGRICEDGWLKAGQETSGKWAEAIAKHAASHVTGDEFDPVDLMDYGMDEDQAIETCERLYAEGELGLPNGVRYRGEGQ